MRVTVDNFDLPPTEVERLWKQQDQYIDKLEVIIKENEKKLCSRCSGHEPVCQVLSCTSDRRSERAKLRPLPSEWQDLNKSNREILMKRFQLPEEIIRICKTCFTRIKKRISVSLVIQKFQKECDKQRKEKPERNPNKKVKRKLQHSILRPKKGLKSSSLQIDHDYCSPNVKKESRSTQTFAKVSIENTDRNYSEEEIRQATLLLYSSPKTYELLRSFGEGRYPCPRTIRSHIQNFKCYFGLNDEMFFLLEQKLKTLPETHRNLSLVFDEIDLQPTTNYSTRFKERLPRSKKALTVMVRGLMAPFKEIIYYNFDAILARERGKACIDLQLLEQLITRVEEAGGHVRSITLDMGNRTLLAECKVFKGVPFLQHPNNKEKKIYIFPDVPHLIKRLRVHILDKGVKFEFGGKTSHLTKDDFEKLLLEDGKLGELRRLYKIKRIHLDCHGHQTQNVRTAVQLLSRSVANSFQQSGRPDLAYFVNTVNNWFDCMDSRVPIHRYNRNKSGLGVNWGEQEESLMKMLQLTENMIIGPSNKNIRKEKVAFQKGIIVSINAVLHLWKDLKEEGFKYLLTHRLNQDCLENLFSSVRALGGADSNPNSVQFCTRIRILKIRGNSDVVTSILKNKITHVEASEENTEESEELFVGSEIGPGDNKLLETVREEESSDLFPTITQSDDGAVSYIAGYITKKLGGRSAVPTGWTALQSYGGLTGATPEREAEVRLMDSAFNQVHGAGAQLNDEKVIDPIKTTADRIKKICPDIALNIIELFSKIKYHSRIKSINEQNIIEQVEKRKLKASERNEIPKRTKTMRDFTKDGHFMNV